MSYEFIGSDRIACKCCMSATHTLSRNGDVAEATYICFWTRTIHDGFRHSLWESEKIDEHSHFNPKTIFVRIYYGCYSRHRVTTVERYLFATTTEQHERRDCGTRYCGITDSFSAGHGKFSALNSTKFIKIKVTNERNCTLTSSSAIKSKSFRFSSRWRWHNNIFVQLTCAHSTLIDFNGMQHTRSMPWRTCDT